MEPAQWELRHLYIAHTENNKIQKSYQQYFQKCINIILAKPIENAILLIVYLIEMPFNAFANRADPDQAAIIRAAWSESTLFAYGNMIYLILH